MATWLWQFVIETWAVFYQASIYILFGFLVAGAIQCWISPQSIYRLLGRRRFSSILLASITGIPLPLCSCSVVPTALALRKRGAGKGATAAFLISTPETSVDSIALTYGLMDLPMTIFRPIASLITAFVAGMATELFSGREQSSGEDIQIPSEDSPGEKKNDDCCETKQPTQLLEKKQPGFGTAFWDLFDDMSYWLLLGLVLAGFIGAFMPPSMIENYLGPGLGPMLIMLVVSVPLYICASASTPFVAALILNGMSPGAALVFLLAGPATNMSTIVVLWKFLGKRVLMIYLLSIVVVALGFGIWVDNYYISREIDPKATMGKATELLPSWLKTVGAIVFIGFLCSSLKRTSVPTELKTVGKWIGRCARLK